MNALVNSNGGMTPRKAWTPAYFLNTASGMAIGFFLFFGFLSSIYSLAIDHQAHPCLPWRVYWIVFGTPADLQFQHKDLVFYESHGVKLIPDGLHIVKYAAGFPGDHIHVDANGIAINGALWGPLDAEVMRKAKLTVADVTTDYTVPDGKLVVLGTTPYTYDSRYWGPIPLSEVRGEAFALW